MFTEYAKTFSSSFLPYAPYPAATNRSAWEALDLETRQALIAKGESYLGFDYPYLKATDFMEFKRTQNRSHYEDKLFSKRLALDALVLAECAEYQGRFLDDIINGIFAICDESAWQLPAHNSYIRDTPQLLLPDTTQPVIELFSCEVSAVLTTACYLLKDALDSYSPAICTRVQALIQERILTPYLTRHFWWMGQGDEPMCNWTVWCTQNILITVFLGDFPEDIRKAVFQKACESVDYFLKDYGEDGCCDEGAQYYHHAGLCLFQTLSLLCQVTQEHFSPLWEDSKIQNIAEYILNVHVEDKYYVNFADCSPIAGRCGAREYWFGKAIHSSALMSFAALDYQKNTTPFSPQEHNLFYRLQEVFTRSELLSQPVVPVPHPSFFYESVGLFVVRSADYCLAVKAGDNDDSHNHNDVGSLTLYIKGKPFLIDVGVETYTQKTFSPQRYEIWTMQSCYHNLPQINGEDQQNGAAFCATNVEVQLKSTSCDNSAERFLYGDCTGSIAMDIASAYPASCGISSYQRTVSFNEKTGVLLTDSARFSSQRQEITLSLMTYEKPVIQDTTIQIGSLGQISTTGYTNLRVETIPITDPRLAQCWKHEIYRILLDVVNPNSAALSITSF